MDRSLVRLVRRTPWRLTLVMSALVVGSIVGASIWRCTSASMSPCERALHNGEPQRAVEVCLTSYRQGGDQRDLVWAAKAYLYLGKLDDAERLAHRLLAGSRFGDAHGILS